jgi:hypothetical protein
MLLHGVRSEAQKSFFVIHAFTRSFAIKAMAGILSVRWNTGRASSCEDELFALTLIGMSPCSSLYATYCLSELIVL